MASKLLSAAVAAALVASSTAAIAQAVPAPAPESVSGDSALFGRDRSEVVIGVSFFLLVFVIAIFNDSIFGDDDEDDEVEVPVSP